MTSTTLELLQKYSVPGPRYTSYPTAPYFHAGFGEAEWVEALAAPAPDRELSLYAHIPFCDSLCHYCGCNMVATRDYSKTQPYLADFYPSLTPVYQRGEGRSAFGVDFSQRLPYTGGTLTATGRYLSEPTADAPFPRTTDLRLLLTQQLLRGVGPNATFFELTNARRAVQGQERTLALARQRTAVEVAAAFYGVIAQRQLLEVARQSLERTEALRKSSEARLEVGLASKLDVFRAELQAAQASDALVRSQAALASALERFRGLLALPPADPVEPEAASLPDPAADFEPVEVLVKRALENRLELAEAPIPCL